MGPIPLLPVLIEVEPGHTIEVPHFAMHMSRQKTRSEGKQWHIRFNGDGSVRRVGRIE